MKRILFSVLVLSALIPAALAEANTYDVYSCWAGYGTFRNPNASSAAWSQDQSAAGGHYATGDDCGINSVGGSMSVMSFGGDVAARGQFAELTFVAPAGNSLAGAQVWRRAWTYGSGTGGSSQRNLLMAFADGASVYADSDGSADAPYGTRGTGNIAAHGINNSNLLTLDLAGASRAAYRVGCGFDAGCPTSHPSGPAPNYFASGVQVFGTLVSVTDPVAPSLNTAEQGLFAGSTATGTKSVVVQAATDASGIKRLAVFADRGATPVGVLDFEQDVNRCDWSRAAPCQNVANVEIPVDTRQLSDGEHSFVVKAYDAASNEKASTTRFVTIDNSPTPDPTPTPPGGGGSGGGGSGLPNGTSTGNGSGAGRADGGVSAGPTLTVVFAQNGRSRLKAKYGRVVEVRGHLSDGAGAPIDGAQLGYSALVTKAGARVQNLGSVRTDSGGGFFLSIPTKLGSRQLRFSYSPQLGGPIATSAQAQLEVIAPVALKVGPRHVRNKHAIVFRGRLGAGPIPRKGKLVNLQVVVDGHWHTFATVRSTKHGAFKYRYRFTRTYGRVTYRFRALSRYEAAYPFIAGHSRTVRVRVN
jgi:hypothetical protein